MLVSGSVLEYLLSPFFVFVFVLSSVSVLAFVLVLFFLVLFVLARDGLDERL